MDAYNVTREDALKIAMSMYLGERCKYCGEEFKTLDDLKDAVFAGYHEHGRLAHQTCWQKHNPAQALEQQAPAPQQNGG